jgi:hypothetical protein
MTEEAGRDTPAEAQQMPDIQPLKPPATYLRTPN